MLTEEQCWDYMASHMMPIAQLSEGPSQSCASLGSGLLFLRLFAEHIKKLPRHKVFKMNYIRVVYTHCNYILICSY